MADCFLPDGVFRRQIAFGPGDADRYGRVDPSALLWQMQEIAGGHYEALGQGDAFIRSHGCFWVVTRSELAFCSYPPMGEALFLETWCGRSAHGLYRRSRPMPEVEPVTMATFPSSFPIFTCPFINV